MNALAQSAPRVTLHVVAVTSASLKEDMAIGRTDLALGLLPQLQAGVFSASAVSPAWCLLDPQRPSAGCCAQLVAR